MGRKPKKRAKPKKRKRPRRKQKPKPPGVTRVDEEELKALIERSKEGALSEDEAGELKAVVETLAYVVRELDEKNLTMRRLRALFGISMSEKLSSLLPKTQGGEQGGEAGADNTAIGETPDKPPPKGHGRNGAAAYTGAERVEVPHDCLKGGDLCPSCAKGKVYEQRHRPHRIVRVEGQAPIKATVYELQAFRCNLCGEVFVAKPPDGVDNEHKYDASSRAMNAVLKYGTGLPFHRLDRLQGSLGVPLPATTQWDLVKASAAEATPVYEELIRLAAQGELLHNDDSTMRVLSLMKENAELRESGAGKGVRTGMFVTGVLSVTGGRRVALFFTGRKHAGENLEAVLAKRSEELGPPLHMGDGLDRNDPATAETVRGCCLAHARRKFVEVLESFPSECEHVLKQIALVYKHDDECRQRGLSAEARVDYHVQHSKPVLDALKKWLDDQLEQRLVEPNSSLGGAINYMLNHWEKLLLFLREPGAPLDNNACERQLKKAILHRKNSLFYKTLNGARVGDLFMSLIYTTELAGENPFEYLTALLNHTEEVEQAPAAWLPWSYRETLAAAGFSAN